MRVNWLEATILCMASFVAFCAIIVLAPERHARRAVAPAAIAGFMYAIGVMMVATQSPWR